MAKAYVMSKSVLKRIRAKTCAKCGLPIKAGEEVVSKRRCKRIIHYHKNCYESLFLSSLG